jgi:thermostable 8-oxoguanine DNA glycosylase
MENKQKQEKAKEIFQEKIEAFKTLLSLDLSVDLRSKISLVIQAAESLAEKDPASALMFLSIFFHDYMRLINDNDEKQTVEAIEKSKEVPFSFLDYDNQHAEFLKADREINKQKNEMSFKPKI